MDISDSGIGMHSNPVYEKPKLPVERSASELSLDTKFSQFKREILSKDKPMSLDQIKDRLNANNKELLNYKDGLGDDILCSLVNMWFFSE